MAKVCLFTRWEYGRLYGILGLVEALVEKGEEVDVYSTSMFKSLVDSTGANFKCYGSEESKNMYGQTDKIKEIYTEKRSLEELFNSMKGVLDEAKDVYEDHVEEVLSSKPDYIISDYFSYWGRQIAINYGIPGITFQTFGISSELYKRDPSMFMERVFCLNQSEYSANLLETKRRIDYSVKMLRKAYGFSVYGYTDDKVINPEPLKLVFTARDFQYLGYQFDDSFKFIGPSIYNRKMPSEEIPFEQLDPAKPMVYISLGTMYNDDRDFFQKCLKALIDLDGYVVAAVGNKIDLSEFQGLPDHIMVRKNVKQLEALKRASLFITHGGTNSVNEAIFYGVPLLIYPQFFVDQYINARRVEEIKCGQYLKQQKISEEHLSKIVDEILRNNEYKVNASKVSRWFKDAGGIEEGVRLIEDFKCKNGIES